jgi:uncharacterized protein (TIGR00299 family) protein
LSTITIIDPQTAGISGDMLLAALIDAGADPGNIQRTLNEIPQYYRKCSKIRLSTNEVKKHGFRATGVELVITEEQRESRADEYLKAAEGIAEASTMSSKASEFAINSIRDLVLAESTLHGSSLDTTHLHEAGSADTLADVFGVAAACDALGIFESKVYSTPVAVGGGIISFSHGKVATPAPAVLEIARRKQIPIRGGPEDVELATPTGISMLANLAGKFVSSYPPFIPNIVGYGAGKAELKEAPNILRLAMGQALSARSETDVIQVLETNLDDVSGEILGHTLQRVIESGAKDAWMSPAQFKKNRPGAVLHVICNPSLAEKLTAIIMEETGTLGVRNQLWNRVTLQREVRTVKVIVKGREFAVRVKFARDISGKIVNVKPEFDDVQAIAEEVSMPAREISGSVLRSVERTVEKENVRA